MQTAHGCNLLSSYIYIYTHTCIYIYLNTHIHTHIHTHLLTRSSSTASVIYSCKRLMAATFSFPSSLHGANCTPPRCMYVCMYVCMCFVFYRLCMVLIAHHPAACMHACMSFLFQLSCMVLAACMHVCRFACMHVYVCMYVCMHVYACMHVCDFSSTVPAWCSPYIHTYMHTHKPHRVLNH